MTRFSLGAVLGNMQFLSTYTLLHMAMSGDVTDADLDQIASVLGQAKVSLEFAGLEESCKKIEEALTFVGAYGKRLNHQALGVKLSAIHDGIREESGEKKFIAIDGRLCQYFDGHQFGIDVAMAFPSAHQDIAEAGFCLALERNTACVFHLMRAVEWGMRALCKDLGLRKTKRTRKSGKAVYAPIEYSEWEKILDQLQSLVDSKLAKLKRGADKQKLQEFYHPALQDLRAFRDAWRNHVMHARAEYTREEAIAVFGRVKSFMETLASRVGEEV